MKKKIVIRFRFPVEKSPEPGNIIRKAINILPDKVMEFLTENRIIFSAEYKDFIADALCISHDDFRDEKYLIHLQHRIWDYDEEEIIRVILHEIAHIYLGHKVENVSPSEYQKQDEGADKLVDEWLGLYRTGGGKL